MTVSSSVGTSPQKHTFKIVVAGIQCVSKSYNFALTARILAGDRSAMMSLAITSINASQSGGGIGVFSFTTSLSSFISESHNPTILPQ